MSLPLSPRSVNTLKQCCGGCDNLSVSSAQYVNIHILTSQTASAITEKKFDRGITISQFKGKLELLTGNYEIFFVKFTQLILTLTTMLSEFAIEFLTDATLKQFKNFKDAHPQL